MRCTKMKLCSKRVERNLVEEGLGGARTMSNGCQSKWNAPSVQGNGKSHGLEGGRDTLKMVCEKKMWHTISSA